MLQRSAIFCRHQTAWRELLHPLSIKQRRQQWLLRDQVELNEAVLREPYYHIKPYAKEIMQRDLKLRAEMVVPGAIGPQEASSRIPEQRFGLQPRYPSSWKTVAPHQTSKHRL